MNLTTQLPETTQRNSFLFLVTSNVLALSTLSLRIGSSTLRWMRHYSSRHRLLLVTSASLDIRLSMCMCMCALVCVCVCVYVNVCMCMCVHWCVCIELLAYSILFIYLFLERLLLRLLQQVWTKINCQYQKHVSFIHFFF